MNLQQFSIALSTSNYRLSSEFVKVLFESITGKRRVSMDIEEFLDACIKLKRMRILFKDHDADQDESIEITFEDCLSLLLKLMD